MIRAERGRPASAPPVIDDPDLVAGYLQDASGTPPGTAVGVVRPRDESEVAALVRATSGSLLPQGARSSLTAAAVPHGDLVVDLAGLDAIGPLQGSTVRVGPGVRLDRLRDHLAAAGRYYPPVPTYQQASVGGTASTNAGGAATFKYGVTREWVRALRVVLATGDVLAVERGQAVARRGEAFEIGLPDGAVLRVPTPRYVLPRLRKISAGYHAADALDLVDLFVGSEGTLGLITEVTLRLVPLPPAVLTGLAFCDDVDASLRLAEALRVGALRVRGRSLAEADVRAVEWMDAPSLQLVRDAGEDRRLRVRLPKSARAAVLFQAELPVAMSRDALEQALAAAFEGRAGDSIVGPLFALLAEHEVLDELVLALPDEQERHDAIRDLREAVPAQALERLARARDASYSVSKVGGDPIVPPERLAEALALYVEALERRGLDFAIWGHLSDGNLHPNALPRDAAEASAAVAAQLEIGEIAMRLGGCPLSEHGVGRSELKQELLRRFLGEEAIGQMRAIKRALDPTGRWSPGVLFSAAPR